MKKNIFKVFALMLAGLTSMAVTSCKSDDPVNPETPVAVKGEVKFKVAINAELFDYFTCVCTTKVGNKVDEYEFANPEITGEIVHVDSKYKACNVSKVVEVTEAPTNISVTYTFKKKDGIELKDEIDFACQFAETSVTQIFNDGTSLTKTIGKSGIYVEKGILPETAKEALDGCAKLYMNNEVSINKAFSL